MRVLTSFALSWDGDDPTGVKLTFRDGASVSFVYPDECTAAEGDESNGLLPLESALTDTCAAIEIEYGDDDGVSEQWFESWLFHKDGPLGGRREVPEASTVVAELSADLSGDETSTATIAAVELSGDLSGEKSSEAGTVSESKAHRGSRKKKKRTSKLREGSGCKQPDAVLGFEAGRLLCVTKNHRNTADRQWGRCEYRVRCNPDGSYALEFFQGNRKDVKLGDQWATVSEMWFALLALGENDPRGKSTFSKSRHHRMTIKRFFNL